MMIFCSIETLWCSILVVISYPSRDIWMFFFLLMFLVLRDALDAKSIKFILLGYPV